MTNSEPESEEKDVLSSGVKMPSVIKNRIDALPGVMPRHAQAWVIGGLALVMVIVIAFSGGKSPKPSPSPLPPVAPINPNSGRIEDYKRRIEEATAKLNQERAQWAKEQQTQMGTLTNAGISSGIRSTASSYVGAGSREGNWIEDDRAKREYQSLYSSNLALTYRKQERLDPATTLAPTLVAATARSSYRDGEDLESTEDKNGERTKKNSSLNRAIGPQYRIFEGSFLETVLTNRLDGAFSGPVNCMTTIDMYSHNGQHVLIPAGSRALGEVKRVDSFGQERLAVVFHRLIMPDGYTVDLDQFRGLNQVGETGLKDQINHHYLQVFGVSIALGAVGGFSAANTLSGTDVTAADAYRQGVAESLSQSSMRILDRYLNILPTITIREGQRVKIYLMDDLLLPAYENHRMPDGL
jgi:type IV secretory pathway VirB10-like protein